MRFLIYILFLIPVFASAQNKQHNYKAVQAYQFSYLMDSCINKYLIDVRPREKFKSSRIENAINLPSKAELLEFTSNLDKETNLFIYCGEGIRSKRAAEVLDSVGFINVLNLSEGLIQWKGNNFPLDEKKIKYKK